MNLLLRVLSVAAFLVALGLGSQAHAQSIDFEDDPAQSTQRDEASRQGLFSANRTVSGRSQGAVANILLGNFFSTNSGEVKTAGKSQRNVSVSLGTDQEFPDLFDGAAVWANVSTTEIEDDVVDFTANTSIHTGIIGYDKFIMDNVLLGFAISRTHADTNSVSKFLGGDNSGDNKSETSLFTLYGAYILNDYVFFDGTIGVGKEVVDFKAFNVATGAPTALSNTDGWTRFASIGVTAIVPFEEVWAVTGNANVFRSFTEYDAIFDQVNAITADNQKSDATLFSLGMQVSRSFENGAFVPYAGLALEHNYQDQVVGLPVNGIGLSGTNLQTNDQTQALLTVGMDYFPTDAVTVTLEGQRFLARDGQQAYGGFFNFRYNF